MLRLKTDTKETEIDKRMHKSVPHDHHLYQAVAFENFAFQKVYTTFVLWNIKAVIAGIFPSASEHF